MRKKRLFLLSTALAALILTGFLTIFLPSQSIRRRTGQDLIGALTGETVSFQGKEHHETHPYFALYYFSGDRYKYVYDPEQQVLRAFSPIGQVNAEGEVLSREEVGKMADVLFQRNMERLLPVPAQRDASVSPTRYSYSYFGEVEGVVIPYAKLIYTHSGALSSATFEDLSHLQIDPNRTDPPLSQEEAKVLATQYIQETLTPDSWPGTGFSFSNAEEDWKFAKTIQNGILCWSVETTLYRNGVAPEDREACVDTCTFYVSLDLYTGELLKTPARTL